MSHPQREETPPVWLDNAFMENALKKGLENENLKILESEMKMATVVGDHYGSQMFRFKLVIQKEPGMKETMSLIVKAMPPGMMGEELKKLGAFDKEEEAFSKILPQIDKLLTKAYPDHKKLWADCYYCQGSPNNLLIFEDLRVSGFVLASRFDGLDLEHSVLVLQSLGKLHAASIILEKENPKTLDLFRKTFWHVDNVDSVKNMFTTPFKIFSDEVLKWDDLEKREFYSEKLAAMETKSLTKTFEIWTKKESKMNVLLHGDSWVNNFMFRYDPNGKLNGINFVDFQLMNWNSPALDLQYFIFTSTNIKYRFTHVDFFLKTYHESFKDTLRRLNYQLEKSYELEDLKKDFEDNYLWGFITLCTIFPLFVVPQSEVCHPDEFFKGDESTKLEKMYRRGDLKKILKQGFEFFDEKGIFQKEI